MKKFLSLTFFIIPLMGLVYGIIIMDWLLILGTLGFVMIFGYSLFKKNHE